MTSAHFPPALEIRSLSPSRAGDFERCPLLYRYRVIDRFPEAPSLAATRGTLVHLVLEHLFDLPQPQRTLQAASASVPGHWASMVEEDPALSELLEDLGVDEWYAQVESLLEAYFVLEDPTRFNPTGRELELEVELEPGFSLRGYVDRLDVAPDGQMRVIDYKTGKAPQPRFHDKALFQMKFYALALWLERGSIPTMLRLLYLGSGEHITYRPTEEDLLATQRKVLSLRDSINSVYATGDFRPKKGPLCPWCDHQERCPEFGGTIPPMPSRQS